MSRITQTLVQNGSVTIPQYAEEIQFVLRGARGGTAGASFDVDGRGALPCSPTYYGSFGHYITGTLKNSLAQTTISVILGQPGVYNTCSSGYDAGSAGGYGYHYGGAGGTAPGAETWCAAGGGAGGGGSSAMFVGTTLIVEAAGGGGAGGGVVDWSFVNQSGKNGLLISTNNNGSNGGTGGTGSTSANAGGGGGGGGNPGGSGGEGWNAGNHIPGGGGYRGTSYYNTAYADSAAITGPPYNSAYGNFEVSYVVNIPVDPPTVSLTADGLNNQILVGGSVTINYLTTGSDITSNTFSATDINGNVSDPILGVGTGGSAILTPLITTTYTYTAENVSGFATESLTITVVQTAPTVTITSNDSNNTINLGQCVNLIYSTDGYFITGNSLTSVANPGSSGTVQVCPLVTTTYTYTSTNAIGTGTASITITVIQIPVVSLTSNDADNAIIRGQSLNLTWFTGTEFITSTSLTNYPSTPGTSGTASFSPQDTTLYTYTATNAAGSTSAGLTITVYIPPEVSISSNYSTLIIGECATLSWVGIANNVTSSSLTGYNGSPGTSGSTTVCPTATTTYTYTVTNLGGTDTDTVTIIVYVPPTVTLTSNDADNAINVGESVTLYWSVSGSTLTSSSLTGFNGSPGTTGNLTVTPTVTTTYTFTAVNLGGTDIESITIVVYQVPQLTVTQVTSVDYGESLSIPLTYRYASAGVSVSETYTYRDPATGSFVSTTDVYQVLTGNGDDQNAGQIVTSFNPNITWNDQGPFAIQYNFIATGSGGQTTDFITIDVDIDLMPVSVNAPDSLGQLPGSEVLSPNDEVVISDPMMVENIDIPVEIKATEPIQVRFDDEDTWHDLRESDL
jgi:hypothetical protein